MHWPAKALLVTLVLALGCGGPAAPLPRDRVRGGSGGGTEDAIGGTTQMFATGGVTGKGGLGSGGTISTYVEPGCPDAVTPQVEAECDVFDQSTCPAGDGCFPTITYPTARCEPEVYRMLCLPAGQGTQWVECSSLTDCAPGFICVVGGTGTECQRACDSSAPTSCPKGLFCDAIDLQGIGTCY